MVSGKWLMAAVAALFMVAGCAPFKPPVRPDAPLDMPSKYSLYTRGEPGPEKWWRAFQSEELNELVEEALSNNFDLRTALARLKQAEAIARQAGAPLLPAVDYEAEGQQSRSRQPGPRGGDATTEQQSWSLGLRASYELDLWGRLRSLRDAELLNARAAAEDLDAAAVTVSASVVEAWVDILAVRRRMAILEEQIETNRTLLELQELRFANGRAGALDVSQQREALAAARSELPLLQLAERQFLNRLAVLLGRASAEGLVVQESTLPEPIPVPETGLPADLLASRPDVKAAGLRLRSSDWEVSAAKADRLPSFNLSARAAFSSGSLDLLFNHWVTALAGAVTGPLFDAGRRKAEVDRTLAVAEQRLAEYAGTVAEAVREVEDSLVAEKQQREYIARLEEQLEAARTTLENAEVQYLNGQSDYLSYLVAWTSVQRLERQLVTERGNWIKDRVSLYRTLGGDWTGRLVPARTPSPDNGTAAEES